MKKNSLKIFFDPQIFILQKYGGISRYFSELAPRLMNVGQVSSVKIVAPFYVNLYLSQLPSAVLWGFQAPRWIAGTNWHFLTFLKIGLQLFAMAIGAIYINLFVPSIIHETYYFPVYIFRRRPKRVITIHDMIHEKFPQHFPLSDKTALRKRAAAKKAHHIICVSESTRRDVIEILGISPAKLSVVYLGVNTFPMLDAPPEVLIEFLKTPYLLYVGERGGYKNFLEFLNAYSSSNRLRNFFNIVCFGGGSISKKEQEAIKSNGINRDRILQVAGDDALLGYLYKNAAVFVYPSLYEGFGIPPLEAISQGCPVVASRVGSITEVVGFAAEYCDPMDHLSIAIAIENVVFDEKRVSQLKSLGEKQLAKFSWGRCAQETGRIYMSLLQGREVNC